MIEPLSFYKDLDAFLANIGSKTTLRSSLFSILVELEKTFGGSLRISNGRLYEERGSDFVKVHDANGASNGSLPTAISSRAEPVELVLQHGSYLYDDPNRGFDNGTPRPSGNATPIAFSVQSLDRRWIFLFDLKGGWNREEVIFCVNACRTALNCRLFSESVRSEFEQASAIQKTLLPENAPRIPGFEFAVKSQPAELVGGDFFDFYVFDDELFGVTIGDAMGHGLPAALLVRDVVTGLRMGLAKELKIVSTLQKLNQVIQRNTFSSGMVSLFCCEMNKDGYLIYANSGHPSPLLSTSGEVRELSPTGLILGAVRDLSLHISYAPLQPSTTLVLYTDGIVERENNREEQFGMQRLKELLLRNQDLGAREVLDAVFSETFEFGKGAKWEDDATVVVIKRVNDVL